MTAALENQLTGRGAVRVNAVCPGFVRTGMSAPFMDAFRALASSQRFVQMGLAGGASASSAVSTYVLNSTRHWHNTPHAMLNIPHAMLTSPGRCREHRYVPGVW